MFYRRGTRNTQTLQPTEGKAMYTVLFIGNAAEDILPPYVIYKSQELHDTWVLGGPPGAVYNCTNSGWMEDYVFEDCFINMFIPQTADVEKPIVIFFNGHNSHLTYNTVVHAKQNDIAIICLPTNIYLSSS